MKSEQTPGPPEEGLVLYGVVGLERVWGSFGTASVRRVTAGRRVGRRRTVQALGVSFNDAGGDSIRITSHLHGDDERYEQIRSWAPFNPYAASPRGQTILSSWDRSKALPRPPNVEWTPVSILVDGQDTAFELCDLQDGFWAAIGRMAGVDVTIDSRGVPLEAVRLERLVGSGPPAPDIPDLGECSEAVLHDLETRFPRLPFGRVRGWAEYWALRDIEIDHVGRLARRHRISDEDRESLEEHWLARISVALEETTERLRDRNMDAIHRARIGRHLRWNFLFQIWFNTVGPGAKTWFGNRYTTIRHYTFRLRWRP